MHKKVKQKREILIILICIVLIVISMIVIKDPKLDGLLKEATISVNKLATPKVIIQHDTENNATTNELKKEISELKEALKLRKALSEYSVETATILSRNKSYWLNNIIIDKGKRDGLSENMAVVTDSGMIGVLSKVYKTSSEVKLITSNDVANKISVSIKVGETDTYGILNGYDKKNSLIKVIGIDKNIDIKNDDIVLTSGLSEYIPRGLYIGKVKKVERDKYSLSKTLYIETKQDFNNIHYVTVLKEIKWFQ
mgnify:CR=1 FL=1